MDLQIIKKNSGAFIVLEYEHGIEVGKTGVEYFGSDEFPFFLAYIKKIYEDKTETEEIIEVRASISNDIPLSDEQIEQVIRRDLSKMLANLFTGKF